MATTIKLKRSSVPGKKPTTSDLAAGEIGLNIRDGKMFGANSSTVFEIGANVQAIHVGSITVGNGGTTFTLPTARGSDKQFIQTNGSGVLSFQSVNFTSNAYAAANSYVNTRENAIFANVNPRIISVVGTAATGNTKAVQALADAAAANTRAEGARTLAVAANTRAEGARTLAVSVNTSLNAYKANTNPRFNLYLAVANAAAVIANNTTKYLEVANATAGDTDAVFANVNPRIISVVSTAATANTKAVQALADAAAANTRAEGARTLAVNANTNQNAYKANVNPRIISVVSTAATANTKAVQALADAAAANTRAEGARTLAVTANTRAGAGLGIAATANTKAVQALADAAAANTRAEGARTLAVAANTRAEGARTLAVTANTRAGAGLSVAATANTRAGSGLSIAATANTKAVQALADAAAANTRAAAAAARSGDNSFSGTNDFNGMINFGPYREKFTSLSYSSGDLIFNLSTARNFKVTLAGNVANTEFKVTNPAANANFIDSFTAIFIQDGTGNRTIAFPPTIKFAGGTDRTLSTGANDIDVFTFFSYDQGNTYLASVAGTDFI